MKLCRTCTHSTTAYGARACLHPKVARNQDPVEGTYRKVDTGDCSAMRADPSNICGPTGRLHTGGGW